MRFSHGLTVQELIEELEQALPDAKVVIEDTEGQDLEVIGVTSEQDGEVRIEWRY